MHAQHSSHRRGWFWTSSIPRKCKGTIFCGLVHDVQLSNSSLFLIRSSEISCSFDVAWDVRKRLGRVHEKISGTDQRRGKSC